jgi:hypothetical protein
LPVGQITLGMHIVEANGQTGIVSGWKVVPGAMTMYNLEVALDHTFVVGMGMWVVHNCSFGDTAKLTDHFNRHGTDFGLTSESEYENAAKGSFNGETVDGSYGQHLTRFRANGDVVHFNTSTDEFGVVTQSIRKRGEHLKGPKASAKQNLILQGDAVDGNVPARRYDWASVVAFCGISDW